MSLPPPPALRRDLRSPLRLTLTRLHVVEKAQLVLHVLNSVNLLINVPRYTRRFLPVGARRRPVLRDCPSPRGARRAEERGEHEAAHERDAKGQDTDRRRSARQARHSRQFPGGRALGGHVGGVDVVVVKICVRTRRSRSSPRSLSPSASRRGGSGVHYRRRSRC